MNKKAISVICIMLMAFLCLPYNVFANDHADSYQISNINALTNDGKVRYQINTSVLHQTRETAMNTSSGTYISYNTECLMTIILTNQSSTQDVYCNNLWGFTVYVDAKQNLGTVGGVTEYTPYKITDVQPLSDNNFVVCNIVGADSSAYTFNFFPNPPFTNPDAGTRVVVPAGSSVVAQFTFKISGYSATGGVVGNTGQFFIPTVVTTNLSTSTWVGGNYPIQAPYYALYSINLKMDELLEAYNYSSQSSTDLNNNSDTQTQVIENQHTQEQNYYNQTNTAINDTNIGNFQFDSNVSGGIGGFKQDFMNVWNSLGTLTDVFILSLTFSLALYIIRHRRLFNNG